MGRQIHKDLLKEKQEEEEEEWKEVEINCLRIQFHLRMHRFIPRPQLQSETQGKWSWELQ